MPQWVTNLSILADKSTKKLAPQKNGIEDN